MKEYIVTSLGNLWPPEQKSEENPERIEVIKTTLRKKSGLIFERPKRADVKQAEELVGQVHNEEMVASLEPSVYLEAFLSAASAIKAADFLINEKETVFAFSVARPPGHHAGKETNGGFCYLNNVALAVEKLSQQEKKVAILDIDFHHGNGTQEIFYDKDILFVSLHGNPEIIYPYSGFPEEKGIGEGQDKTLNLPFKIGISRSGYLKLLKNGLEIINKYEPDILAVSAGFDTHELDFVARKEIKEGGPTKMREEDFGYLGEEIGKLKLPTLLVLEGGYNLEVLGNSVANFIDGLHLSLSHQ